MLEEISPLFNTHFHSSYHSQFHSHTNSVVEDNPELRSELSFPYPAIIEPSSWVQGQRMNNKQQDTRVSNPINPFDILG